jgi:hypothetical protein
MALCCCGTGATVKEFTVLLIHVLQVSHPAALEGSTRYARDIVDRLFSEHTEIDVSCIERYNNMFSNLTVGSRLEIAFGGRPERFRVRNYKICKYEYYERKRGRKCGFSFVNLDYKYKFYIKLINK